MTPEAKVKKKAKDILNSRGAVYCNPMSGGYGFSGVLDIIACYKGWYLEIEAKAKPNKPTALQLKRINDIRAAEGISFWFDEDGYGKIIDALDWIDSIEKGDKHE